MSARIPQGLKWGVLGFPVTPDHALRYTERASITLTPIISYILLTSEGEIALGQESPTYTVTDRSSKTGTFRLRDGILVSAIFDVGAIERGRAFVSLRLEYRGITIAMLAQGYGHNDSMIAFPGSLDDPINQTGLIYNPRPAAPAAGNEFVITVPTSARWRIKKIRVSLTTSATVAARTVSIGFDDGTNLLERRVFGASQAASLTYVYETIFGAKADDTAVDANNVIRIYVGHELSVLPPGWRIRSLSANFQAGDAYTIQDIEVEEWIDP